MKKYIILASVLFALSCGEKELDLLPLDRVTADTFYKTRGDFDGAIFASYSSIQDLWGISAETLGENGEYWKISVVISDDAEADTEVGDAVSQDIDKLLIRSSDVPYGAAYTQIYEGIYRANLVLENLEGENELSEEDKTIIGAEAKFLRGWFHFQALKMFGTPPLAIEVKTDLNDLALPNATQEELYASILSDLADAAAGLPEEWDGSNTGRATSWAAKSYIGKVNVWKEDWPTAITALEDVVLRGPYMLMPEYSNNFSHLFENNAESIFEIQFGGPFSDDNIWVFDDTHSENFKASQGTTRSYHWGAANGAPGGKRGWFIPSEDLLNAYEAGDSRLETTIYQEGEDYYVWSANSVVTEPYDPEWSSNGLSAKKYLGKENAVGANRSPNGAADFNNERWFRFAELKLLYAEALIQGGGDVGLAFDEIDDIRERAGLGPVDRGLDPMDALMQEKRVELALEPHRYFDIARWGIGADIFGAAWDDKFNVLPFPLTEIDRSKGLLKQNPGY
ncbi:RagB/SusD family nutrient uptake outer membrane protein [Zobellia galactanivorans]|uniref:RagB/SusD family nutrient uptake outer membrane protein n=1 Tax=Zobellia galactanivorans (strain DSM 12802 / CCUG 47099 / CIP 106680 / NCIMB 13871 / Dsij) TaxID=63186 RepID=UPI0026E38B42|nr:RagB/SusD family nutrient uptake outer membrane protein [Zobellia galactanivorans]MDO6810069.1 RagB/SusD family nutrient uptake outer membrane protein [Zobellia galactanivorans]